MLKRIPGYRVELPDWRTIEVHGLTNPTIHLLVDLVNQGKLTQEQALLYMVVELAEQVETLTRHVTDAISKDPPSPRFLPKKET